MTAATPRFHRLVLVGGLVVDLVLRVEELPRSGDDVRAERAHAEVGGGFAVLAAARRHGLPAAYGGLYGNGPFGTAVRTALDTEHVDALLPQVTTGDSGFRTAFTGPGGARMSVTSGGVEGALDADTLRGLRIDAGDAVYLDGGDLVDARLGSAVGRWLQSLPQQTLLVFDPGGRLDEITWPVQERVLRRCDVLTLSAAAVKGLVGTSRPAAAWRALREYAPRLSTAVFRHGPDGCWVGTDTDQPPVEVPAPPVDPVTGPVADGLHTGVLLANLAQGRPASRAALRGNVAVALFSTRRGGHAYPEPAAVDRFLATSWRPE
ncbi:MAG: hypothetical protein GEV07_04755 [Streptosporangiales bacterium]|nr:hypothetical protein [Streptosporangiales bacterium]